MRLGYLAIYVAQLFPSSTLVYLTGVSLFQFAPLCEHERTRLNMLTSVRIPR